MSGKSNLIWNIECETMPRKSLGALQLERLNNIVTRVSEKVPYYRDVLAESGIIAGTIQSLEDIAKLPFTTKQDLRNNYPLGLLAIPRDDVLRLHASSGTTGKPTVSAYSQLDLDVWAEAMARVYALAGVTRHDVVHNAYGYGLFTGGLGFHLGAEKIGAMVVPVSAGLSKRQIMLMEDFGATVLASTPSYALVLAEAAREAGVDFASRLKIRVGLFGGEPWTDEMRREIKEQTGMEGYDSYGLTEIIGPGVALECGYHEGLHIAEDHFFPEVVDPESGAPLPDGEIGELVLTSLTRDAMPLLRYRTRDRVCLNHAPCACGRTMVRMSKVQGRTDDMLVVRGVNIFPSQIEGVVLAAEGVEPHYLIIVDRPKHELDHLEIWVEASPAVWEKGLESVQQVERRIFRELQDTLCLTATVSVLHPGAIQRSEGKARRIIDKREISPSG
jgi:phenylacetate-CoA ligase